jgi:tetratricopeptide (TPR) repeat protein
MTDQNFDETQPTPVEGATQPAPLQGDTAPSAVENALPAESTPQRRRSARIWWILLALLIFAGSILIGSLVGYQSGIKQRTSYEATEAAAAIDEQFSLGLQDIEAGRYEVARQRFEYVIQLDPAYPGATDRLAEVLLVLNATATPTLAPTPTTIPVTPTPDLRGELDLFNQAQTHVANQEWEEAVVTLETLRQKNPDYEAIAVDGMFFVSLRNRGIQKISLGSLEGGIYDLTLAERFGPLDTEADSWRTWARYYLTGASFWDVDWANAVYYFGQVAPQFPNMHDGTGWTASQRYLEAVVGYANWLAEHNEWCSAVEQYDLALELGADNSLNEARDQADLECSPGGGEQPMPPGADEDEDNNTQP